MERRVADEPRPAEPSPDVQATPVARLPAERRDNDVFSFELPGQARGRALISYLVVDPEHDDFDRHSNRWECAEMIRILRRLGYAVDIVNFFNQSFVPKRRYDVVLDIGITLQRLVPILDERTLRLLHFTQSYTRYANKAELRRVADLERRRRSVYTPKALAPYLELFDRSLRFAHRCSVIGNRYTLDTFPKRFQSKLVPITVSASRIGRPKSAGEYRPPEREFIWFFGMGAVRKGLDLVLEVFSRRPDLTLNVVGPYAKERDLMRIYAREFECHNIRVHGEMNPAGHAFRQLVARCFCFVAPSSYEGISPACATLMQIGLFPILSRDTGIDLPDGCGMWLEDCSLDEIERALDRVIAMDEAEFVRQVETVQRHAFDRYSRERFALEMGAYIETALKDWKDGTIARQSAAARPGGLAELPPPEQAAVDGDEPGRNQRHARDLENLEPFPKKEEAEQDRAHRHDQGDQRGVGGAGRTDQAEIKDVSEGGGEQGQRKHRRPYRKARGEKA